MQALFVAEIIEVLHFIDAASPNADHVHVRLLGARQQILVVGTTNAADKAVCGNPVRALGENGPSVDHELKAFPEFVGVAVQRDRSQPDATAPAVEDLFALDELETHLIERLIAMAVRPPQFGIRDFKLQIGNLGDDLVVSDRRHRELRHPRPRACASMLASTAPAFVPLADSDRFKTVSSPCLEADRLVNAAGGKSRAPVPPKRTLLLSDVGATTHGIVPFRHVALISGVRGCRRWDCRNGFPECFAPGGSPVSRRNGERETCSPSIQCSVR